MGSSQEEPRCSGLVSQRHLGDCSQTRKDKTMSYIKSFKCISRPARIRDLTWKHEGTTPQDPNSTYFNTILVGEAGEGDLITEHCHPREAKRHLTGQAKLGPMMLKPR